MNYLSNPFKNFSFSVTIPSMKLECYLYSLVGITFVNFIMRSYVQTSNLIKDYNENNTDTNVLEFVEKSFNNNFHQNLLFSIYWPYNMLRRVIIPTALYFNPVIRKTNYVTDTKNDLLNTNDNKIENIEE